MENYKNMTSDFEQNHHSTTATGIYRIGHDSIRFMKRMAYFDRYYENKKHFDLMASVLTALTQNE